MERGHAYKYSFVAGMLSLIVPTVTHAAATDFGGSTAGNADGKYTLPNPIKYNSVDELIRQVPRLLSVCSL